MKANFFVVIGMAGSGKSTMCRSIAENSGFTHVATGDIVRALAKQDPAVKAALDRGEFAPQRKMNMFFRDYLRGLSLTNGVFLLDGYPRYRDQLMDLYLISQKYDVNVGLIYVDCDVKVARERLLGRGRADDFDANIDKRAELFFAETYPLLSMFNIVFRKPQVTITQSTPSLMAYQAIKFITDNTQ
jgi:adenylate kinase